jgi:hypothetical protein
VAAEEVVAEEVAVVEAEAEEAVVEEAVQEPAFYIHKPQAHRSALQGSGLDPYKSVHPRKVLQRSCHKEQEHAHKQRGSLQRRC